MTPESYFQEFATHESHAGYTVNEQTLDGLSNGLTLSSEGLSHGLSSSGGLSHGLSSNGQSSNGLTTPLKNIDWLDKFCMDLGYHCLAFLTRANGGVTAAAASAAEGIPEGTPDVTSFDEPDGCITDVGHRIIKAVVAVILDYLIDKRMKTICTGCEVDHPSQTRHSCLFEPPAYFFYSCFDEISLKLQRPELKTILAQALNLRGITTHLQRIQGSIETILYELRDEMFIVAELSSIRQKLIDESCEEIIFKAVDSWKLAEAETIESTCA